MKLLAAVAVVAALVQVHAQGAEYAFEVESDLEPRKASNTSATGTSTRETSTESSSATTTSLISVNPADPQGNVVLKQPSSTSSTYVKSGQKATFKWSYTNLVNTPSAINVEAVCSDNGQTYTIAHKQSPKVTSVVWDTANATANQTDAVHLITAKYTLQIYDSNSTASAQASAGSLGAFTYTFGLYLPQKYVPWPKNDSYINRALTTGPGLVAISLGLVAAFVAFLV